MGASGAQGAKGALPITYRLEKVEHSEGRVFARIAMTMSGSLSMSAGTQPMNMHMVGHGYSVNELSTGMARETQMTMDNTIVVGGVSMTQHMVQHMTPK